jgi:general stress protein 26
MSDEQQIVEYIKANPVMVLSTVDDLGVPHGAAVYVYAKSAKKVYCVTKTDTRKLQNLRANPHAAITIVNTAENSSLQATGHAETVQDAAEIEEAMGGMAALYAKGPDWLPPITKLRAGPYQVVAITLKHVRLARYLNEHPGSKTIFTEV